MSRILVGSRVVRAMVMEWEDGDAPYDDEDLDDERADDEEDLFAAVSRARRTASGTPWAIDDDPDRRLEAMIGEPTF